MLAISLARLFSLLALTISLQQSSLSEGARPKVGKEAWPGYVPKEAMFLSSSQPSVFTGACGPHRLEGKGSPPNRMAL